jgi:hypothetical protein
MPPYERSLSSASSHSYSGSSYETEEEHEIRTSQTSCENSLTAVLSFLRQHGVSKACMDELRTQMMRASSDSYIKVLQRAQDYCACVQSGESLEAGRYLLIGCWSAVLRHQKLLYRRAYRHYHGLRRQYDGIASNTKRILLLANTFADPTIEIERALKSQVQLAEVCCTCQRELVLAHRREQQTQQQLCR